ncbi:LamG domain-containing protein [Streptomyces griseofuscus]|uniref:LamG domain-containing protein n=1 Tax=Streptomyces griseofuscus TaxID=146922 RepID=UPI0036749089
MPRSGKRERSAGEHRATRPRPTGDTTATDDLALARRAAASGRAAEAAAAELSGRHLPAVFGYAARCTATPQAAALLTTTALEAALAAVPAAGADTAWRPHVLAGVLRTAAGWLADERRHWLDGDLTVRLPQLAVLTDQEYREDERSPVVTAFHRMPVRHQVGLWHLLVEGEDAESVARHLGTDAGVVRGWLPTVAERFRAALVEICEERAAPACRPFTRMLVTVSETDAARAGAARAGGGLDAHLETCGACTRALADLARTNGPGTGAALAEALLPWGGRGYAEEAGSRAASGHPVPGAPGEGPAGAPKERTGGASAHRLFPLHGRQAVLVPLGVCAAVVSVIACVTSPQFQTAGEHTPAPTGPVQNGTGLPTRGPAVSASSSAGHRVQRPGGKHAKNDNVRNGDKGKGRSGSGSGDDDSKKAPGSHSAPPAARSSAPPAGLAVSGARLRWDFDATAAAQAGYSPPSFQGGARHSTDRDGSVTCNGNGYVNTSGAVIDTAHSFTVSLWARLTSTSGFQTVASQDGRDVSGFFLQYSDEAGRWRLATGRTDSTEADESQVLSKNPPALNQWQHLTAVYDGGAQQIRLYVNGVLQGTDKRMRTWSANGSFSVGRGLWDGAPADLWHGGIDDVRVYARALDPAQIRTLATAGPNT